MNIVEMAKEIASREDACVQCSCTSDEECLIADCVESIAKWLAQSLAK